LKKASPLRIFWNANAVWKKNFCKSRREIDFLN
jgi:hypothetical protein